MESHGKSDGWTNPWYNLTFDEVQHQLGDSGKPLSSMNLDELLKSVWTAETEPNQNTQLASTSNLSNKTVDELWRDIIMKDVTGSNDNNNEQTLGEMTLEDFLVRAGVVRESCKENKNSDVRTEFVALARHNSNPQVAKWMQHQVPPVHQQHVFMPAQPETQITISSDTQTKGMKRLASGDWMEKTRESDAYSRARKLAYTHELEDKVSRLEEENERLKREQVPKALEEGKKPMVVVNIAPTQEKYRTAKISLPREVIEKQYGKTQKEAAYNLKVSESTLKRNLRKLGILVWPGPNLGKRMRNDSPINQIDTDEEDNVAIQDTSTININKTSLTIKVEYEDDVTKFCLPLSEATFVTIEKEIGKKLKLSIGTYKLKYRDEDGEWILLTCDEEVSYCIKSSEKLDPNKVRLRVLKSAQADKQLPRRTSLCFDIILSCAKFL